jgi:hypothetical protein
LQPYKEQKNFNHLIFPTFRYIFHVFSFYFVEPQSVQYMMDMEALLLFDVFACDDDGRAVTFVCFCFVCVAAINISAGVWSVCPRPFPPVHTFLSPYWA